MSDDAGRGVTRPDGEGGGTTPGGGDEPPPILGRWSRLYALIVIELAAVIAILYWLTRRFG